MNGTTKTPAMKIFDSFKKHPEKYKKCLKQFEKKQPKLVELYNYIKKNNNDVKYNKAINFMNRPNYLKKHQ